MLGYRLYHPVLVASAMLLPLSLRLLAGVIPRRGSAGLVTAAFVVVCAVNAAPSWLDRRVRAATRQKYVHRGIEIGKWMRANCQATRCWPRTPLARSPTTRTCRSSTCRGSPIA